MSVAAAWSILLCFYSLRHKLIVTFARYSVYPVGGKQQYGRILHIYGQTYERTSVMLSISADRRHC